MTDKHFAKALRICCDTSNGVSCCGCILYKYKMNENGELDFLCFLQHAPTHEKAMRALENVVRENPQMFPREILQDVFRNARVV